MTRAEKIFALSSEDRKLLIVSSTNPAQDIFVKEQLSKILQKLLLDLEAKSDEKIYVSL
ncbi:MAG: hypothetical protein SFT91_04430 [Rickettsiaceae bacterium]|nr:hypothetical protein [Rickettsiaceae bacterium]